MFSEFLRSCVKSRDVTGQSWVEETGRRKQEEESGRGNSEREGREDMRSNSLWNSPVHQEMEVQRQLSIAESHSKSYFVTRLHFFCLCYVPFV